MRARRTTQDAPPACAIRHASGGEHRRAHGIALSDFATRHVPCGTVLDAASSLASAAWRVSRDAARAAPSTSDYPSPRATEVNFRPEEGTWASPRTLRWPWTAASDAGSGKTRRGNGHGVRPTACDPGRRGLCRQHGPAGGPAAAPRLALASGATTRGVRSEAGQISRCEGRPLAEVRSEAMMLNSSALDRPALDLVVALRSLGMARHRHGG